MSPLALLLALPLSAAPLGDIARWEDLRLPASQELVKASSRGDASVRRAAVRAMGRIQSPAYAEALVARLKDRDEGVLAEAVFALGQLGLGEEKPKDPEALCAALEPLALRPELAPSVYEAWGKLGGAAREPALAAALASPQAAARTQAALGLFRLRYRQDIPEYSTAAVSGLLARLSDPDADARWSAAYAFSRWPEPRASEALAKAVADPALWVRFFAARALGQLKGQAPLDPLMKASRDLDALVRAEAVKAIGAAGQASLLDPDLAEDESVHVRAAYADAAAGAALAPLEYDASPLVRGQVLLSLAKAGASAEPRLLKELTHPHWWVRSRAYLALAAIPGGADQAKDGVFEKDQRIASAALEGIAKSSAPIVDGLLERILRDPASSLELRGTAADLAAERKSPGLRAAAEEALKNSSGREWYEVRDALLKALGRTPEPAKVEAPSPFLGKAPKAATILLETEKGPIEIELYPQEAPAHAASLIASVQGGVYTGTIWHRVVSGFVVQGGDPRGSGMGDAGFSLRDEINRVPFERGTLGMPKAGKDTGGCQLFITHVPTPHLDGRYTAFGKVVRGMDAVDAIEPGDKIISAKVLASVPGN